MADKKGRQAGGDLDLASRKILLKGVALEALWISDVEFLLSAFQSFALLRNEHMALNNLDGLGGIDDSRGDEEGGVINGVQNELQQSGIGP